MKYLYPLTLSFKLIALAPRVTVIDVERHEIFYIEQKVFALKEAVKVFNNAREKKLLYLIKANQMLDFGAKYFILTPDGKRQIGSVHQEGMRSLFRASYAILDADDNEIFRVTQTKPWAALLDSLLSVIPFVEFITGFILNPTYAVSAKDQQYPVLLMKKKPSFLESNFTITRSEVELPEEHELLILLSLLMIVQLERGRG